MSGESQIGDSGPEQRTRPKAPRRERAGIDYPEASWTSFDRYSRYGAIASALRLNLGPGAHVVLDVGDNSGWLRAFDPELVDVTVDPTIDPNRIEGTQAVVGDGARLPIRDRAVAAVVSSDALEHVAPANRPAFLEELARVTSDLLIVAAPFDTPGVAGAEEFAARYVFAVTGVPQVQLDEHKEHGLPSLESSIATLEASGLRAVVAGNGNLHDWLLAMLLKHQLTARPALDYVDLGFDILYNLSFAGRNHVPPYYRHVIVARRDHEPRVAAVTPESDGFDGMPSMLAALLAGTAAEATKQDFDARLRRMEDTVNRIEVQYDTAAHHFMERFSGVESMLSTLLADRRLLRRAMKAARHPLMALDGARTARRASGVNSVAPEDPSSST